jgi:hypothetical protein
MTPEEQIEQWVAADDAWVEDNYDVLAGVYQYFLSNGEWPTVQKLIQLRAREGSLDDRAQRVLDSIPLIPGQSYGPNIIMLSARHLVHFPEAKPLVDLIARATKFAIILIGSPDETPRLSRDQMINQPPQLTEGRISLLPAFLNLISLESPRPFGGYSMTSDDWSIDIDVVTALKFASVSSIEDFLSCQRAIVRENLERFASPAEESDRGPILSDVDVHVHLEVVIGELRSRLDADVGLPSDVRSDVRADIDAAATQLRAEHPNTGVIRGAFNRLGRIWPQFATVAQTSAALIALLHGL